jgi:anti-sigma factor RsiW
MNQDFQLKLQAYVDGELSEREVREVEGALAGDAEARALLAELQNTNAALATFEAELKLPETREFYWSKIQRQIEREQAPAPVAARPIPWWQRFLIPAGGVAALVIAVLIGLKQNKPLVQGPFVPVETHLSDSGAMTYRDQSEGLTVVWLSYPAENEFAEFE